MSQSGETLKKTLKTDVVIIGMGPAGLTAAVECLHRGLSVIILDKRDEATACIRPQLVYLKNPARDYLKSLELRDKTKLTAAAAKNEESMQKQLDNIDEHIAIKDIQRFLRSRVNEFKHGSIMYQANVSEINMEKGYLTVDSKNKEKIKIEFGSVIAADGAYHPVEDLKESGHNVVHLLKKSGHEIKHTKTFESQLQHFVSSYFRVKRKDGRKIDISDKYIEQTISKDGYDYLYYHHASLEKTNGLQLKFYVTSCIPKEQEQKLKDNKEVGIQHLINIARGIFPENKYEILPVKNSEKHGIVKDNLKYQIFRRQFYEAATAGIEVGGRYFLLIGDAYNNPDFYQGIGTNSAMTCGGLAAELLSRDISLAEFQEAAKIISDTQLKETQNLEEKFKTDWQKIRAEDAQNKMQTKISELHTLLQKNINAIRTLKNKEQLFLKNKTTQSIYDPDLEVLTLYRQAVIENRNSIQDISEHFRILSEALENKSSNSRFFKKQITKDTKLFLKKITENTAQLLEEYKKEMKNK